MWKKDGVPEPTPTTYGAPPEPAPTRAERVVPASVPEGGRAIIGRSITIRGEVTGDEDLLIQGRVDGSVDLKQHSITIGRDGQVKADVIGHIVTVEGVVEGNLTAAEQVILRASARVHGDITAPRVVLEDGARFRGGVDMGEAVTANAKPANAREATSQPAPAAARETVEPSSNATSHEEIRAPRARSKADQATVGAAC